MGVLSKVLKASGVALVGAIGVYVIYRPRIFAAMWRSASKEIDSGLKEKKETLFSKWGAPSGVVLEIGAGVGANMQVCANLSSILILTS